MVYSEADSRFTLRPVTSIVGRRFGNLVVLGIISVADKRHLYWHCKCDCGNTTLVRSSSVRTGKTVSCGCLIHTRHLTHGQSACGIRGGQATSEYTTWVNLMYTSKHLLSKRWLSFENFFVDMGKKPVSHRLSRIDSSKLYMKSNCEWVQTYHLKNLASKYGVNFNTLSHYVHTKRMTVDTALNKCREYALRTTESVKQCP